MEKIANSVKACHLSRTQKTDARNAKMKEDFEKRMIELKDSGLQATSQIDIAITELSEAYFIGKTTVRQIITGYIKYSRKSELSEDKAQEKAA